MNTIQYLLAFLTISGLLYGYYHVLLRNEQWFQWNRFYLLAILPLSAILPLLEFEWFQSAEPIPVYHTTLEAITIGSEQVNTWAYDREEIITMIYLGISSVLLVLLCMRIGRIIRMINTSRGRKQFAGAILVQHEGNLGPSSFGRFIFWNQANYMDEKAQTQILQHELAHIRHRHSIDILILECIKVMMWINPIYYLISKEIKLIHEYQADRTASQTEGQQQYIHLILSHALGHSLPLSNHFFHVNTKKRIMMLRRIAKPRLARFKYVLLLPFLSLVLIAYTHKEMRSQTKEGLSSFSKSTEVNYGDYDIPPKPTNLKELYQAVPYPEEAKSKGIQGKVMIEAEVDENGGLDKVCVDDGPELLSSALIPHVFNLKFEPAYKDNKPVAGSVKIPFVFKLANTQEAEVDIPAKPQNMAEIHKLIGYPKEAAKQGIEGNVIMEVLVDTDGKLLEAHVKQGPSILAAAVAEHIEKLVFEPGLKDGKPVQCKVTLPFHFRLTGDARKQAKSTSTTKAEGSYPKAKNLEEVYKLIGYPKEAEEQGIEGTVVVEALVDADGKLLEAHVKQGHILLSKAVGEHIDKLTFEPAVKDGNPIKSKMVIPFRFKLLEDKKTNKEKP